MSSDNISGVLLIIKVKAEIPPLVLAVASAPFIMSNLTTGELSFRAAKCKAVYPNLSGLSINAPA